MSQPTKGIIEAEIANAITRFQREQQGRGPSHVRAHLIGDMIVVRCSGILTPTEARLAESEEGVRLIRSARQELRSINKGEIEAIVGSIVGCAVLRSYCDINVKAAELIEIYVLENDTEAELKPSLSRRHSHPDLEGGLD